MGPADLPARPKFSWDLRNAAPWTDAKGPQDGYFDSVKLWKSFHDKLPASNPNKIPPNLQGIILQSQLFGRALDLSLKLSVTEIEANDGALKVAGALFKRDALSVVTDSFQSFLGLLGTRMGENETFNSKLASFIQPVQDPSFRLRYFPFYCWEIQGLIRLNAYLS